MNKDEIKEQNPMPQVLASYGIEVKRNMCRCPFHGDKSPSMKVFKDGCHCFTCNQSWDIFSFVMEMEHCDFKTAFLSLGGHYEKTFGDGEILKRARLARQRKQREQEERDKRDMLREFTRCIALCKVLAEQEPLSDAWCDGINGLEMIDRTIERGEEITRDVFRRCVKLRQKYLDVTGNN